MESIALTTGAFECNRWISPATELLSGETARQRLLIKSPPGLNVDAAI